MIQCTNPECRAENPTNARFCRKCGRSLPIGNRLIQKIKTIIRKLHTKKESTTIGAFTLDIFRSISFQPVSVVKIRFVNRLTVLLCVVFVGIWIATTTGFIDEVLPAIDSWFYEEFYDQELFELVSLSVLCLCGIVVIRSIFKSLRYKYNADYIEERFVENGIVRIARKSHVGLFDKKKKKVLLSSIYSNIEKLDNQHLLISKNNKIGCYSLKYRKIIIPVSYDSISNFVNSVTSATVQGIEHHYDKKGNRLQ